MALIIGFTPGSQQDSESRKIDRLKSERMVENLNKNVPHLIKSIRTFHIITNLEIERHVPATQNVHRKTII